jgi:hypothetical protein
VGEDLLNLFTINKNMLNFIQAFIGVLLLDYAEFGE